jgi:hypothetical protein
MRKFHKLTFLLFSAIAVALAAFHSPGQMSVDSVAALYEGATGVAAGWGPTFFSAFLAWLGRSVVGTSMFIAINCYLTYGCFSALLVSQGKELVPRWQLLLAFVLALNPLFMFYVGIIWKDVMLATAAMAAGTSILLAANKDGRARYLLLGGAAAAIASLALIRQQGFLVALPFTVVVAFLAVKELRCRLAGRVIVFLLCAGSIAGSTFVLDKLANHTVRQAAASPVSVGLLTIRAYDIAGMIKYAAPGDAAGWAEAAEDVQTKIKSTYSPERIDSFWHDPIVRGYFDSLSEARYSLIWKRGIEHDPRAYLEHRINAFMSLLGTRSIEGCVPAYWGIAGIPEQLAGLSLREEMDARARVIGRASLDMYGSPVFRNWFYVLLLIVSTVIIALRARGEQRLATGGIAVAAWLYLVAFAPTTIACDFRYLYPVATLSTILCIFLLTHVHFTRHHGTS